jgi:hypothetical protein
MIYVRSFASLGPLNVGAEGLGEEGSGEHDWKDVLGSLHVMSFRVTPLCGLLLQATRTEKFSRNFNVSWDLFPKT